MEYSLKFVFWSSSVLCPFCRSYLTIRASWCVIYGTSKLHEELVHCCGSVDCWTLVNCWIIDIICVNVSCVNCWSSSCDHLLICYVLSCYRWALVDCLWIFTQWTSTFCLLIWPNIELLLLLSSLWRIKWLWLKTILWEQNTIVCILI